MAPYGHSSDPAQYLWFVQVDAQVYGPFDADTMQAYFDEGRVTAQSLISDQAQGPFAPCADWRAYAVWSGQDEWTPSQTYASPAEPTQMAQMRQDRSRAGYAPSSHILLIMAELQAPTAMNVVKAMQRLGSVQRVSHTVWILQTGSDAAHARAFLQDHIGDRDRVLIADITGQALEGLNVGHDVDRVIQSLERADLRQI